jgi:hypothetical protein
MALIYWVILLGRIVSAGDERCIGTNLATTPDLVPCTESSSSGVIDTKAGNEIRITITLTLDVYCLQRRS